MNKLIIVSIALTSLVSSIALAKSDAADVNLSKKALNVDFNRMIDGNNVVRNEIQKNIVSNIADTDAEEVTDKSRVLDFVNLEIGLGQAPGPVVDRRFDSVAAPVVVASGIDLNALVPKFF